MTGARSMAQRRYLRRMAVAAAFYVATLFAGNYLIDHAGVTGPVVWLLALLPGLGVLGFIAAIGLLIVEEEDEFLRLLIVRQTLIATGIALSAATVWGFFEEFGLVAHVEAFWWAVIWFFGFGIGGAVNRVTMGAWGECG